MSNLPFVSSPWLKKLDLYIIKKVLGAYFLMIVLLVSVAIVFDISEKIDTLADATMKEIIFDYYLNFAWYFSNLLSPLITFIAVIFITSQLANNSEIIATFASGISFHRVMVPYWISAAVIAVMTYILSSFVIPPANEVRLDFLAKYKNAYKRETNATNVQLEVEKGVILYIGTYEKSLKRAYRMTLEKFDGKTLVSRTTAQFADYDTLGHFELRKWVTRDFVGMQETMTSGERKDTTLNVDTEDFFVYREMQQQMTNAQLERYIEKQRSRGVGSIQEFEIEYEKRHSQPFAAFILTTIGFALASKKVKGGMGMNLGIGLALSFSYILFDTISATFAISGGLSPRIAVWIPNFLFLLIAMNIRSKRTISFRNSIH